MSSRQPVATNAVSSDSNSMLSDVQQQPCCSNSAAGNGTWEDNAAKDSALTPPDLAMAQRQEEAGKREGAKADMSARQYVQGFAEDVADGGAYNDSNEDDASCDQLIRYILTDILGSQAR